MLAEQGGADAAKVREALLGGFADSTVSAPAWKAHDRRRFYARRSGQVSDQGHRRGSRARQQRSGSRLPVATEVDRLFRGLVAHGGGDLDHSAAIVELRRINSQSGRGDRQATRPHRTVNGGNVMKITLLGSLARSRARACDRRRPRRVADPLDARRRHLGNHAGRQAFCRARQAEDQWRP